MANPVIRDLSNPDDDFHMRREPPPRAGAIFGAPVGAPAIVTRTPVREDPAAVHKSIDALVKEVRDLRVKSDNDDRMIALLEEQRAQARKELEGLNRKYANQLEAQRIRYEDEISVLRGTAEVATQKAQAVNDMLQDAASRVLEAARVMAGQQEPPAPEPTGDAHPLLRDIGADL